MRLFIAIEIPDTIKGELSRLRTDLAGARWVPATQLHVTLAFLGDADAAVTEKVAKEVAKIQAPGFDLAFTGVGCFPNRHHPRVLWVGLRPEALLTDLASQVRTALVSCNIAQEDRPFSPHVTVARFRQPPKEPLTPFIENHQNLLIPSFAVRDFILFQSRLTPDGAIHTPLSTFPLLT